MNILLFARPRNGIGGFVHSQRKGSPKPSGRPTNTTERAEPLGLPFRVNSSVRKAPVIPSPHCAPEVHQFHRLWPQVGQGLLSRPRVNKPRGIIIIISLGE